MGNNVNHYHLYFNNENNGRVSDCSFKDDDSDPDGRKGRKERQTELEQAQKEIEKLKQQQEEQQEQHRKLEERQRKLEEQQRKLQEKQKKGEEKEQRQDYLEKALCSRRQLRREGF